ncbi:hypothetical protein HF1_02920 [Mycoplasma haemofelis str. Langford 1]|uniref:Uncharacterized protein n=1 Tax=Mycoplasma haemofelis (strain Langford 1) TaxID=941640 RepID=E8ZGM9_MYCHL|nr:hypothetical protein [Mycoplasma haemofelis]CBY92300.1 hypothetical protein HF1_02920 [Mycoplasma haemofelis str. Langford 1]
MGISTLGKVTLGLSTGATATAGAVYFGTDLFKEEISKRTISSLLREKNPEKRLIIAAPPSDKAWKDAWANYRNENKDSNPWGIKTWSKITQDVQSGDNAPDDFVSKCATQTILEVPNEKDSLYVEVLKYCTRNTVVSDLIAENTSKKLLNGTGDQDSGGWAAAWEVYRTQNKASSKTKDTWEFSDWDSKKDKTELPTDYKTKCTSQANVPAFTLDNKNYKNVLAWCTKD